MAEEPKTPATPAEPTEPKGTPPWGDDFDAARAWRLVENLRAERDEARTERDSIKAERDSLKADAEGAATRAQEAEQRATTAERKLLVDRAVREHALPDGYEEFLTGDTEEEIFAKAERLSGLKPKTEPGEPEPKKDEEPTPGEPSPARPTPALTPGHGGTPPEPFDAEAIAKAARARAH